MKHETQKLTLPKEKKNSKIRKEKKKRHLPATHGSLIYFPVFLLLCNAVIRVEDVKVVQFKENFVM